MWERRRGATILAGLALTATTLAVTPDVNAAPSQSRPRSPRTTINVAVGSNLGRVQLGQLGVNHRFNRNGYDTWDARRDRPRPQVVRRLRAGGVTSVRYPGGMVANLYDWKDAIGPQSARGCQTRGNWTPNGNNGAHGLAYGPDEHMRLVRAIRAKASIVVPYVTETPADAADWVEYMNITNDGPGGINPNGGVDWAARRAQNGHPAPYNIRLWEVGNEQRVRRQRYWMSPNKRRAMRQYIHGDTVLIQDEALGKNCRHPNEGVATNGLKNQVFEVRYPPMRRSGLNVSVGADRESWRPVSHAELAQAGADERVVAVDHEEGELTFGDGVNGALPPTNAAVRATYRSVHKGVFSFLKAMKRVDNRIQVCPTWGLEAFIAATRGRRYDCFSVHSYTHFRTEGHRAWRTPTRGHDWHMLGVDTERKHIAGIKRRLPRRTPIALTEFGAIWGNDRVYPMWAASMTHATYMASMWVYLLDLGIPWATGSDLVTPSYRGLLGRPPGFNVSAEALTRQAIAPLYKAGGRRLRVGVSRNPTRNPRLGAGTYRALTVAATRARNRNVYMLVVNRLPRQRVRATVSLGRHTLARGRAYVTLVNGRSFRSANTINRRRVFLRRSRQRASGRSFVHSFPAHSVTVLRVPIRRR